MCPDTGSLESPSRNPLTQEMECSLTSPSRTFPASRTSNSLCTRIWPSNLSLATFYSIWGPEQAHTALPLPTVGGQAGPHPWLSSPRGSGRCPLLSPLFSTGEPLEMSPLETSWGRGKHHSTHEKRKKGECRTHHSANTSVALPVFCFYKTWGW